MVPKSAVASVRTRIPTETDWSTSRSARESTRALNARGREVPAGAGLEQRSPPERSEEDERDDEDDRRGREEEGLGTGRSRTRRSRGRAGSRLDGQVCDLNSALLELDLEAARKSRLERNAGRSSRGDVAHDVVSVQVDLVGDVRLHDDTTRSPSVTVLRTIPPSAGRSRRRCEPPWALAAGGVVSVSVVVCVVVVVS